MQDEDVPEAMKTSEAYAELMWLKLMKRAKSKQASIGPVVHHGYRCDHCGTDPISGVRWHCTHCAAKLVAAFFLTLYCLLKGFFFR